MRNVSFLLIIALAGVLPDLAAADAVSVSSPAVAITERTAGDGTAYYSVAISLPKGLTTISHARLEFRADVSAKDVNGFVDPAPVLDVYALQEPLTGEPEPSEFTSTRIPMSRPVATGANRLVRIDVTEYVQKILADPSKNFGLVLGPLTADKRGIFEVKENGFGDGVAAQIRIVE